MLSDFKPETDSKDYYAATFKLNNLKVIFRKAKITPNKKGQFVTLWKRNSIQIIEPFNFNDDFELIVISVFQEEKSGIFLFSKSILAEQGVISSKTKEGKRAIRVYPVWEKDLNNQANKTQTWQLDYFIDIPISKTLESNRFKLLQCFGNNK